MTSSEIQSRYSEARSLHQKGEVRAAVEIYEDLKNEWDVPLSLHFLLGLAQMDLKNFEEAYKALRTHLEFKPEDSNTRLELGRCLLSLGNYDAAFIQYRTVLETDPDNLAACLGVARIYELQQDWANLLVWMDAVKAKHTLSEGILRYRIRALRGDKRYARALVECFQFLNMLGPSKSVSLWGGELLPFLDSHSAELLNEIEVAVDSKVIHFGLRILIRVKDLKNAKRIFLRNYEKLKDEANLNEVAFALMLNSENQPMEAVAFLEDYLIDHPNDFWNLRTYIDIFIKLAKKGHPTKYRDAKEILQSWLEAKPNDPQMLSTMATFYQSASRPELALPYLEPLIEQDPLGPYGSAYLFGINYDEKRDPVEISRAHFKWGTAFDAKFENQRNGIFHITPDFRKKLRIGYISPDLGLHPVGYFFVEVLEGHDLSKLDVFLYSNRLAENNPSAITKKMQKKVGMDRWRWTRGWKVNEVREQIRKDKIDILVDLAGHTAYNRLDVLACRAAPIQVAWLGYPNTTGLRTIDYRISDEITEPEIPFDQRSSEKIIRLPNGFHVFHPPGDLPGVGRAPCIQRGYVTFGTFNNMNKLGSKSIELWANLLKRVQGSRILIKHSTLSVPDNKEMLKSIFAMHGIQSWRVELKETTPSFYKHMESYREMDIALDPLWYNGTTTTCDALAMGVPVITLPGDSHASRVSASLLHRAGLDDWIAKDADDFLAIGSSAALNFKFLDSIRSRIREKFNNSPLRDGEGMAKDLEAAFYSIWEKLCDEQVGRDFIKLENQ